MPLQPSSSIQPQFSHSQKQQRAPLFEQLQSCAQRQSIPFHTPGHKAGNGTATALREAWGKAMLQADLPELPELDNLFAPSGVIAEAQALAAEAFGAERTWFSANGSTAGVMAAILATCGPGDAIVLPRTVHKSVISGLVLSGAHPIFVAPAYDPRSNLVGGLTAAALADVLASHRQSKPEIKAVMVVSPSYEGICGETEAIAHLCHQHNIPLLVDEAHGPHFGFHPDLPPPALSLGADLAIQSIHKVLSALTQAAMVHVQGQRIDPHRLSQALALVQSTSPNYLLLASLDVARRQMALEGAALMAHALALAEQARQQLKQVAGIQVLELPSALAGFTTLDPTRLTVEVRGLGLTGFEVDEILCDRHGVIAELPTLNSLTFIISLGNCKNDIDRLVKGFQAISLEAHSTESKPSDSLSFSQRSWDLMGEVMPAMACNPREAFYGRQQAVAIAEAIGKPSAETICPYPPGIPVLLPGEIVTAEAVHYLRQVQAEGGVISGCADETLATLRVVML